MESLSIVLSSSSPFLNHPKTHKLTSKSSTSNFTPHSRNPHQIHFPFTKTTPLITQTPISNHQSNNTSTTHFSNLVNTHLQFLTKSPILQIFFQSHVSFLCMRLSFPLSCFASETTVPTEEVSNKINLEAIVVSIDDFFNRNPFFVAGVTFIWLIVIPLTEEYLQKYKFISAIDSFRKLRDEPNSQMLDIRDKKSLGYLGSPNLKILNKGVVQIEFSEEDEEGFVKNVLGKFNEPGNTTICILDNFDGNSMKVAELLVNNGFKEAYAIRGGARGKNGWQAIQETLLPPTVHIYPTKKVKRSKQLKMNGGVTQNYDDSDRSASVTSLPKGKSKQMDNGYIKKSIEPTPQTKLGSRSLSPYPNEVCDEGIHTGKEEARCSDNDEPIDNAILVHSYDDEVYHYDFHVVYSNTYRVPVLYFHSYCNDGQPLALDDIEKDLPANSAKVLMESKWTFITREEHPYLNRPWYTLHPCGTSEWMKLLFSNDDASSTAKDGGVAVEQYLVSWFSVVGQVFGLKIPFEMLANFNHL